MSNQKQLKRTVRRRRIRAKVKGTAVRPRLAIFRSNAHISAQLIDDVKGNTLVSESDYAGKKGSSKKIAKVQTAKALGLKLAESAKGKGISTVVFDRGGFIYTGRVKAFAEGAREGGLEF